MDAGSPKSRPICAYRSCHAFPPSCALQEHIDRVGLPYGYCMWRLRSLERLSTPASQLFTSPVFIILAGECASGCCSLIPHSSLRRIKGIASAGLWWGESVSTRRGDDLDVSQVPGAPLEPAASVLTPQLLILHTAPHRETGQRGGGVDAMLFPSTAAGLTPA
ncbi:unnamed protein product [Arctogadus glacialis]